MNNMNAFDSVFITHARRTERIILGALLSYLDVRSTVFGMVDVDYFCEPVHRVIYRQMRNFYDANDVIDILTIDHALIGNELYIQSGGLGYLTPLTNGIVEAVFIEKPCLILRQIYILRQAFALGWEIQQKVCNGEDVGDLLKFLNGSFSKLNDLTIWDNASSHISVTVKKALQEAYDRQEARKAGKAIAIGTGLKGLDHLTGGWKKSELVVLAARPSMGKSALMLYFAKMAAKAGNHVCLYSQEMSPVDLVNRLMLSECDVDSTRYRDGNLTDEENKQISRVAGQIERLPIYLNDKPNVSMSYIREDAKKRAKRGECDIIMVDYLQLLDMNNGRNNNTRDREVAEASRQAKLIAKELNVPLILLSQLNREVEKREEKEPMLADLRDSGAIEQDADIVCLIHRPAQHGQQKITIGNRQYNTPGLGFLYVKKQRNGRLGCVVYRHNSSMTQMSDYGDRDV